MSKTHRPNTNQNHIHFFFFFKSNFCDHNSPLRALLSSFAKAQKGAGRTKWVNSPNVYQKVEVLETGTPDPKKITKVQVMTIQDKEKN